MKKYSPVFLFLVLMISIIALHSCSNNDDGVNCKGCDYNKSIDTFQYNAHFLSYTLFDVGSKWIYQRTDSSENIFDTVIIVDEYRYYEADVYSNQLDLVLEFIVQDKKHSTTNFGYRDTTLESLLFGPGNLVRSSFFYDYYFFYPYDIGNNPIFQIDIQEIESLQLSTGINFPYTIKLKHEKLCEMWMAPHVGIVKIEIFSSANKNHEIWELNEYNINH
ncbi:MAG: hypothetical protein GC181_12345 [Bacteroidetes bacterium]|nr:hypothetical protein [Bacteroidota bacterium]